MLTHSLTRSLLVAATFFALPAYAACDPNVVDPVVGESAAVNATTPSIGWYYMDEYGISRLVATGGSMTGISGDSVAQDDASFAGQAQAGITDPGQGISAACDPGSTPPTLPTVTATARRPGPITRILYIRIPSGVVGGGRNVAATYRVRSTQYSCSDEVIDRGREARRLAILASGVNANRRGAVYVLTFADGKEDVWRNDNPAGTLATTSLISTTCR